MGIDKGTSLLQSAAELRHQAEERLSAKTMEAYPPRTKQATTRLVNELEIYQIEMEEQNTELRRAQEELENQQAELEMQNEELTRVQESLELSRNKYSELYDFAPIGYFTFDARGIIREANLSGAHLLGIERRLLVNKPFISFIADATERKIFSEHLETVFHSHEMQRCEIKLKGKEGTVIYGQLQSVTVNDSENKKGHILCSIVDGTVAKQLGIEAQDAREYAENIVETVRKPLVVLDFDLRILTANRSFYETFKVTKQSESSSTTSVTGNGTFQSCGYFLRISSPMIPCSMDMKSIIISPALAERLFCSTPDRFSGKISVHTLFFLPWKTLPHASRSMPSGHDSIRYCRIKTSSWRAPS